MKDERGSIQSDGEDSLILKNRRWFARLIDERDYRVAAEVGVFKGEFASHLLQKCPRLSMILVDPWDGSGVIGGYEPEPVFRQAHQLVDLFGVERVMILRESSPQAAAHPLVSERQLDFVYIDGNHSFEAVVQDIKAWWPLVRFGGVLAGHDYNHRRFKGVKRAVDSLLPHVNQTQEACASWWIEKRNMSTPPWK